MIAIRSLCIFYLFLNFVSLGTCAADYPGTFDIEQHQLQRKVLGDICSLSEEGFDPEDLVFDYTGGGLYSFWWRDRKIAVLNSDNQIVEIDFERLSLKGELPESLVHLKFLEKMYFEGNRLSGKLPEFISQLPALVHLDLKHNCFTGDIPESWENKSHLAFNLSSSLEGNPLDVSSPKALSKGLLASSKLLRAKKFLNFTGKPWGVIYTRPGFLLPNEAQPEKALPIWETTINPGVYVSVGTERSIIGALKSKASHLLVLDMDPQVIVYMRALVEILKLAEDNEDFYRMRMDTEYLRKRISQAFLDKIDLDYLLLDGILAHGFWNFIVNDSHVNWFWKPNSNKTAQYWDSLEDFARLQSMAKEGRIQAEVFNFKDLEAAMHLKEAFVESELKISFLDLSNAHDNFYIGMKKIDELKSMWQSIFAHDSHILFSWFGKDRIYTYVAFPLQAVKNESLSNREDFIEKYGVASSF